MHTAETTWIGPAQDTLTPYSTTTFAVAVPVLPSLSVTVKVAVLGMYDNHHSARV